MSDIFTVVPFSKKNVLLRLHDPEDFSKLDKIVTKMGGLRNNSNDDPGWIFPKDKVDELENALFEMMRHKTKRSRNRHLMASEDSSAVDGKKGSRFRGKQEIKKEPYFEEEESNEHIKSLDKESPDNHRRNRVSEDEDDESSDDEMIQSVLQHRIKSESSGKCVSDEFISDSDNEDVVNFSRRLRHIYVIIKDLRSRIVELEDRLKIVAD